MSKMSLAPWKILTAVAVLLSVLIASVWLSFQRFNSLTRANNWNTHTYHTILEANHLLRGVINIQAASRGFIQTGEEDFLENYYQGRTEFSSHHQQILQLTSNNPIQQKRLRLLQRQYTIWINGYIEPLLKRRRATKDDLVVMRLSTQGIHKRRTISNAIRQTIGQIEKMEYELLAQRTRIGKREQALTKTALLLNAAFATTLALLLSSLLISKTQKMEQVNRHLREQITRREQAEHRAQILHNHNEMILEAAQDAIVGVNQKGRITFFNPAAEAITGYSAAEVIGKKQHDILHFKRPDGSPYPFEECPVNATLRDGKVHSGDNEIFWHKDGRPFVVEFTSAPLLMPGDPSWEGEVIKTTGAVVSFRNITKRQQTERRLQELASMVQYSNYAIIGMNMDGIITSWNPAATKVYGYLDWEMIGESMDKLVPDDAPEELPALLQKIRQDGLVELHETTRLHKNGTRIQVALSLAPAKNADGALIGASSISRRLGHEPNLSSDDTPLDSVTSASD